MAELMDGWLMAQRLQSPGGQERVQSVRLRMLSGSWMTATAFRIGGGWLSMLGCVCFFHGVCAVCQKFAMTRASGGGVFGGSPPSCILCYIYIYIYIFFFTCILQGPSALGQLLVAPSNHTHTRSIVWWQMSIGGCMEFQSRGHVLDGCWGGRTNGYMDGCLGGCLEVWCRAYIVH